MGAEPNWTLLATEYGGLPNPDYDKYVRTYCDVTTKSTVCVTVGDGMETMFGDSLEYADGNGPELHSWCGYVWDNDGTSWEISYGPDACEHWVDIDGLLWGAFVASDLWAVDGETHCVKSPEQMLGEISQMRFAEPEAVAAMAVAAWQ